MNIPFFDVYHKLHTIIEPKQRRKLYWLAAVMVVISFLDMLGVVSIFPFLKVVSSPGIIETNAKLKWLYHSLGFQSTDAFIIALGLTMFVITVLSNICRGLSTVMLMRAIHTLHCAISTRLLTQYLYEPYVFFLNRNSAGLVHHLMTEVGRTVSYVLMPFLEMLSKIIFVLTVLVLLVIVNPLATIIISVVMGGGYGLVYFGFRNKLEESGAAVRKYEGNICKILNEIFGGIKDIKLLGKEDVSIERFFQPAIKVINIYATQSLITNVPRYIFETLSFGTLIFIAIYSVVITKNYQDMVPTVGLYALAAYRIIPILQQIFQSITYMRFGQSSMDSVYDDMLNYKDYSKEKTLMSGQTMTFEQAFEFQGVSFKYPRASKNVIEDFNLTIKARTTVGFVGGTGAGKTTVIDILLGLLRPQQGELVIDGTVLMENNLRMWQKNIGYVPQYIYLADDTVTRNIAFGVPDADIDHEAVMTAAKLANIHQFITQELPHGYETEVGERGVRLSGGQRQRIGIARALYHDPSVLVFDEATSALDGITEDIILESIHHLAHKKTIIIIAHRFTTVKECDKIYVLEKGKIIDTGTYKELLEKNEEFRKMARMS